MTIFESIKRIQRIVNLNGGVAIRKVILVAFNAASQIVVMYQSTCIDSSKVGYRYIGCRKSSSSGNGKVVGIYIGKFSETVIFL